MQSYVLRDYQKGFERDQARIGREVAQNWIWPYAYDLDDLLEIHTRPDFDPETRHCCFLGDEMVGYMFSVIAPPGDGEVSTATIDFPRMTPGHEPAAERLMEKAVQTLRDKGVSRVVGRVTTMCPGDIRLAENAEFSIYGWGYKVYYSYDMEWGLLNIPSEAAQEINPEEDLNRCAGLAALWYGRPLEWCRALLEDWHEAGVITHLGVRSGGQLSAACMVARNIVRPSTAAIYYIYTPDEQSLQPMLVKAVNTCVDDGVHTLIADLIHEHRQYEPVYQAVGFKKAAEWARWEKLLA